MDRRLRQINSCLAQYSLGNFNKQLKLSPDLDQIDAISNGINMVMEELKATTISKNYFTKIFNSVSDMVFITDRRGMIKDVNYAGEQQLQYSLGSLTGKNIQTFFKENPFRNEKVTTTFENTILPKTKATLVGKNGNLIPVSIKVSSFEDPQKRQLQLITASDISFQIRNENQNIRAIIDMQEKERQRFAKDMHDSLIQKLYTVKFQLNSISKSNIDETPSSSLAQLNKTLNEAIKEVRNICFNLMPKILEEFGLMDAIKEYTSNLFLHPKPKILIRQENPFPQLPAKMKIDIYRVIQEFINNSSKHGKASKIEILFRQRNKFILIILSDNGKGFDHHISSKGMGLQNVQSRIKSHNGTLTIYTKPGKGTSFTISIPLKELTNSNAEKIKSAK